MRFPEYNILESLFPNINKSDFDRIYGNETTLDEFCAKVGGYMVSRSMFPNDEDPMAKLQSLMQQQRQVAMREPPQGQNQSAGSCCGGGQVK